MKERPRDGSGPPGSGERRHPLESAGPRAAGLAMAGALAILAACAATGGAGTRSALVAPPFENTFEWAGLRFAVRLLTSPPHRLAFEAEIENTDRAFRRAHVPACFPWIRAYRDDRRVWDQGGHFTCLDSETQIELEAGERASRRLVLRATDVLGDSLPAGDYRLELYVPRAFHPGEPPRAERQLPLGTVRLEPPPEP